MNVMQKPAGGDVAPHVHPTSIVCGTFVTRDLARTKRMCEEVLNLETITPEPGMLLARERGHKAGEALHGKPYWVLEAREVSNIDVPQEMLNHWGVFVESQAAVDEAHKRVDAANAEYGLGRVQKPRFRLGSYAFYFVDADSNWWEVEYRTPELLYTSIRDRGDQA
jgi:catechol 2,3-dioxygenase-like lactoylglutathione lyase family enzyme